MKTRYTILYIAIFVMFSLTSCINDLPVHSNEQENILILNGYIAADSTNNVIRMSMTGNLTTSPVRDGIILLSVNGIEKETLTIETFTHITPEGENQEPTNNYRMHTAVKPGDKVRLDAQTKDGKHHAWVEETVPQPIDRDIKVDTLTVDNPFTTDYSSIRKLMCYKIGINDRKGEENYYQLAMDQLIMFYTYSKSNQKFYTNSSWGSGFTGRNDIVLTDGNPTAGSGNDDWMISYTQAVNNTYGVFDDSRFKDKSYTLTVYNDINSYIGQAPYSVDAYVRLRSINQTAFYYFKAMNLYHSDSYDETLSGSMKFPTNVHDGTGIVVLSSETDKAIKICSADLNKVKEDSGGIYTNH